MDGNEVYGDKAWWQLHKNTASCMEQFLEATSHKTAARRHRPPSQKLSKLDKPDMQDTDGEIRMNS